ncbi:MAG: hypothetical protein AAFQ33_14595 [Pseudomonadota bacterium]
MAGLSGGSGTGAGILADPGGAGNAPAPGRVRGRPGPARLLKRDRRGTISAVESPRGALYTAIEGPQIGSSI